MSKNLDKLKDGFLQDLSNVTDDKMDQIKQTIGIKNNKPVNVKPSWIKINKKPLTWALSSVMACLIIVISIVSIINYRNTPVYREMIATNVQTVQKQNSKVKKLNSEVENDILDEIGVFTLPDISCYANPEEEIIITVKIDNPKAFEILSFTLNGYKYQTFEFEYGSNSNQILVKFTTDSTSGIQNVTIDAIKYVDGDKIKDARFDGDKTIKIGVTYQNVPTATLNVSSKLTDGFAEVIIKDDDKLMDEKTGVSLYLFDEENLVRKDDLIIGNIAANYFPHLKLGTKYTFFIVGVFDLFDGQGKKGVILARKELITEEGYTFGEITKDYEKAEIELIKTDKFTGTLVESKLYQNDELVQTITLDQNATKVEFTNLLSNTTYKVVTSYEYLTDADKPEEKTIKEIETIFTTDYRPMPTLEVSSIEPTKEGISFDYIITDTTDVGKVIKVEVYRLVDDVEIITDGIIFNEDIRTITGLLSNNDYRLRITYQYDLLDGNGEQTFTVDYTFKTIAKEKPVITFKDVTPEKKAINFNYDIVDVDSTGSVLSVDLIKDEEVIKTITNLEELTFAELLSDNDYILSINYQYDLNDGNGSQNETVKQTVHTIKLDKPLATITVGPSFNNNLYTYYHLTDTEDILNVIRIELYKDEELINTVDKFDNEHTNQDGTITGDITFKGLDEGEYLIVIVYEFDLNDGKGVHTFDYNIHPSDPKESNTCKGQVE